MVRQNFSEKNTKKTGSRIDEENAGIDAGATSHTREDDQVTDSSDIVFHVKDNSQVEGYYVRVFSEKEHGEDFEAMADEFEKSNTHRLVENPDDREHVREVREYNSGIPHPVTRVGGKKGEGKKTTKAKKGEGEEDTDE